MSANLNLNSLNEQIETCALCPRLRTYCKEVAQTKRAAYQDQEYWGRPVGGYGDSNAELIVLGLAPGAHGANRTGRLITGDKSGEWLFRALFEMGFSSRPESNHRNDGLILTNAYITNAIHCAPPENKPKPEELKRCGSYLQNELQFLQNKKVILALGSIAYLQLMRVLAFSRPPKFSHGLETALSDGTVILGSYHPSQQNTFTGRLKWDAWIQIFKQAKARIEQSSTRAP
jgi:uracil-DNA glycosylase